MVLVCVGTNISAGIGGTRIAGAESDLSRLLGFWVGLDGHVWPKSRLDPQGSAALEIAAIFGRALS
jgi:hypothetical protein